MTSARSVYAGVMAWSLRAPSRVCSLVRQDGSPSRRAAPVSVHTHMPAPRRAARLRILAPPCVLASPAVSRRTRTPLLGAYSKARTCCALASLRLASLRLLNLCTRRCRAH